MCWLSLVVRSPPARRSLSWIQSTVDLCMAPCKWGFDLKSQSTNYPDHGHHGDPPTTRKIPMVEPGIEPGTSLCVAICNTFEKYALSHLCFYQWSPDFISLVTLRTLAKVCPQDDHEILANANYISRPQRITFLFIIIIIIIIIIILLLLHGLGRLTCSGIDARSWTPQVTILVHLTWIRLRLNTCGLKLTPSISINR